MPSPTNPAEYCRTLRQFVQSGVYDFYTANAMWQNYRKGLQMFGVDPGPCALGPEAPTQSVIDAGGGDGGFSLAGPDAAYGVQDTMAAADPNSWFPAERPQINLGFDGSAGGGLDPGTESYGEEAPTPLPRMPVPEPAPAYVPRTRVMAQAPDGTYYPVRHRPMPVARPAEPAAAPPSPYGGVQVTWSFGIKDL